MSRHGWRSLDCICQVCRYWRDAALDAATLWSDVDFTTMPPGVAHKMLRRSKQAALNLAITPDRVGFDLETFSAELYRVETLRVHFDRQQPQDADPPPRMEPADAPLLQRLTIGAGSNARMHRHFSLLPPESRLPALNAVIGHHALWSQIAPYIRPTVTSLRLVTSFNRRTPAPTMADFLNALNEMPHLKSLTIRGMLVDASTHPLELPIVRLPSLDSLTFHEHALVFAAFLDQVILPASTFFSPSTLYSTLCAIFIRLPGMDISVDMLTTWLRAVFVKIGGEGVIGSAEAVNALRLSIGDGTLSKVAVWSAAPGADEEQPSFPNRCAVLEWIPHCFYIREFVDTVCNVIPELLLSHITTLVLSTDKVLRDESRTESFLSAFPVLENLRLQQTQGLFVCFARFRRDENYQTDFPFPKLQRLTLEGIIFRESGLYSTNPTVDTFCAFREMLEMRQTAGCSVRTLRIYRAIYLNDDDLRILREVTEILECTGGSYRLEDGVMVEALG